MLPAKNRLKLPVSWDRRNPDFNYRSPLFKLIAKKIHSDQAARIGFIITTKVGKATVRNRIKRKLAELTGLRLGSLPNGTELIWIVYPEFANAKDENINSEVDRALSKIAFAPTV